MPSCAVGNSTNTTKCSGSTDVSFHRFPTEKKPKEAWIRKCGRKDMINLKNARVCSEHFLPDDFDSSFALYSTLVGTRGKRKLKAGSIPSVKLPGFNVVSKADNAKARAGAQKANKEMPSACAVAKCSSYHFHKLKTKDKRDISCFRFPKEPALRATWIERCSREDEFNPASVGICSKHFVEEDYDPSYFIKKKFMPDVYPRLRKGAVPTVYLPVPLPRSKIDRCSRAERQKKRENKEMVRKLLESSPVETSSLLASRPPVPKHVVPPVRRRRRRAPFFDIITLPETAASPASPESDRTTSVCGDDHCAAVDDDLNHDCSDQDPAWGFNVRMPSSGIEPATTMPDYLYANEDAVRSEQIGTASIVTRTREILHERLRVRRLEDRCRRLLADVDSTSAAPGDPLSGAVSGDTLADLDRSALGGALEPGTGADSVSGPGGTPGSQGREAPLVVLRETAAPVPDIVSKLREYQVSDERALFTPATLQEALEANHQLKLQNLAMQAGCLRWAIRIRRAGERTVRRVRERCRRRCADTVKRGRLRGLLRLERAVKEVFTEPQVKAITRDCSAGVAQRKKVAQWGDEDVRRVLELRAISSDDVVDHVREKMKIPLPSMNTVKLRCKKSPELNEAYREMAAKLSAREKLCGMCQRQIATIDTVAEARTGPQDENSPPRRHSGQGTPRRVYKPAPRPAVGRGLAAPSPKRPTVPRKRARRSVSWERDSSDSEEGFLDEDHLAFRPDFHGWQESHVAFAPSDSTATHVKQSWKG